ncbi:MAG TPA: S41 family peptidase [Gemmatimonadales bacterium]|nr:S41 family peptidase [Gemmatimonadales bacterium]
MMRTPSRWVPIVLVVTCSLVAHTPLAGQASYEQLQTFSSIINQIRLNYVDSVTYAELVHAAIDGVLESLDPHSRFVTRADGEREMAYEAGSLAGTGIVLEDVDGSPTVQTVLPGSPAARSGVSAGDRLLSVDDTSVAGLRAQAIQPRLLGEKGKRIKLILERGSRLSPQTLRISVKHDFIEPRSVTQARMLDNATGYVRLVGFHEKGGQEMEDALRKVKGDGAKRVMVDLRGNPGGNVFSAVEIASLFFKKGTLVFRTEGRIRSANRDYTTEKDGAFSEMPLLLLVDRGSASAAEALAGSLQDHDRALLLGRRTFGKALMQQALPVPPQGDMVWLTVGHVVTPSGRVIQRAYHGLKAEQYYSFAGKSGAEQDTLKSYQTEHGRSVRGGGGILPDISLPEPAALPPWFFAASDSGYDTAVSDSVAGTIPKDAAARARWLDAVAEWQSSLVKPFMDRVHSRLQVTVEPDSALSARVGRILAYRVTEVRWGPEALDEMLLRNDPDIRAASNYTNRISEELSGRH